MRKKNIDMTDGTHLFPNLCLFVLPLLLAGILQLLYNASDLIVCGTFGSDNATAAISATTALINLIVNLFLGLSVGANVLMARCYGASDPEKGSRVLVSSMVLAVVVGVVIGTFGAGFSRFFLIWMSTPDDVIGLSTQYLTIYFLGAPFSMIYNFGASLLRATGETKKPFLALALSGIVNVGLNLLFVIVFHLNVMGVAICTVIAQVLSAIMIVAFLMSKHNDFFRLRIKELHLYKRETLEIIRIGLPAGIQSVLFSLSNVMIQSSVNSLGTAVMGGNGAASSLEGFIYTSMNSVSQSTVSFASANYGARNKKNIRNVIVYSLILILALDVVLTALELLLARPLLGLYVKGEDAIRAGFERLLIILPTYFLCGFMEVFAFSLRAIGYSMLPTLVTVAGVCGIRLLWIFVFFPLPALHSLAGLALSYPVSWVLTILVHLGCFLVLFHRLHFDGEQPPPQKPHSHIHLHFPFTRVIHLK